MDLKFKLFGFPEIYKDGKKILFPYSKINAFIYYIILEKTVSRSEIAGMLWPEESEKTAKKNLRNVLYHTKKLLHKDIIKSPNNTILTFNEDFNISIDVIEFSKDPINNLELYEGEFLKGFYIKDSEEFDLWIQNKRISLFDTYYSALQEKATSNLANGIYTEIEVLIQRLISLDNLDEKNYRILMKYYLKTGRISKIIETYGVLTKLLKEELNVEPNEDTKNLYEYSLEKFNSSESENNFKEHYYFGREKEIVKINRLIKDFKKGSNLNTIYIQGDFGIGKSSLISRVYQDFTKDFQIYSVFSYQLDRGKILKPMELLLKKLSGENIKGEIEPLLKSIKTIQKLNHKKEYLDFEIEKLEENFLDFFLKIDNFKIFNFEDIHWMDSYSVRILTKLILNSNKYSLFFINGIDDSNPLISDMVLTLRKYEKIEKISIYPFTKEESKNFIKQNVQESISDKYVDLIFNESEGIPFFISEFLNQYKNKKPVGKLTSTLENAIRVRFIYLSDRQREILKKISFFKGGFPLSLIYEIVEEDEKAVVDLLDLMVRRNILVEYVEKERIYFKFSHKKIREYLYFINSKTKRKYFHKIAGDLLEKNQEIFQNQLEYFQELSYHYKEGGDFIKELKYNIEILSHYLNFSHELFPVVDILDESLETTMYTSSKKILEMFEELHRDLKKVQSTLDLENFPDLKLKFYHMRGRYYIRQGKYEEGLEDIKYIIRNGSIFGYDNYVLKGYKQMIFYYIQINNSKEMMEYIEESLKLAVKCNFHKEIGMLLRLKGLGYIMTGDYENGEKLLLESINNFNVTASIASEYAVNIAAAHNYIGEIRMAEKNYERAIEEFEKAIDLTKDKRVFSSLSVFYINMGKTYFYLDNLEKAKEYFNLALKQYENFDFNWKVPVLNSYMSLVKLGKKEFSESKEFLLKAEKDSDFIGDPRSEGTVYFTKFIIKNLMKDSKIQREFKEIISESSSFYKEKALDLLDKHRDIYEIEKIEALNEY